MVDAATRPLDPPPEARLEDRMTATAQPGHSVEAWPPLPFAGWQETQTALQLRAQIVGKTRLAQAPMQNHWWQVAFYVTTRGLTTSPMPHDDRTFEVDFDFLDHLLLVRTSDGVTRDLPLRPEPLAEFYTAYQALLRELALPVHIWPVPQEMAEAVPFPEDHGHAAYDGDAVQRFWRALTRADRALKAFRGGFLGKCSPVHFWWGGFDLSCSRFSGRPAPPHPGGIPHLADRVTREAYSHECSSAGWWPGSAGMLEEPAFYSYAYAEPPGFADARVGPAAAYYHPVLREWVLPYEAVRRAADPDAMVAEFLQSTYEAAATLGDWDRAALERGAPGSQEPPESAR